VDPGQQAMRDAQRASEQANQRMNQQQADDAARRSMRESQMAGERATEAARRSTETWVQQQRNQARETSPREHGLIATILLFPFRAASLALRLAILVLVIALIAGAAYVILGGSLPV
jgi:Flp pilus assembly protein TadB